MNKKVEELTEWINWNYIGLAAGILSVLVTMYNINQYWKQIQNQKRST
jgi:hypothetical protein